MRKLALALPLIAVAAFADHPQYGTSLISPPGYTDIYATAMTIGPDGNTWVSEGFKNRVGRLTVTLNANGTTPSTYAPFAAKPVTALNSITTGPDGNLWFTETGGKIARMGVQGSITEFSLNNSQADLGAITAGPDGALWFIDLGTFTGTTKLGRVDVNGSTSEFSLGPGTIYIRDLTTGADGNLWFVDSNAFKLYKASTAGAVLAVYSIPNHGAQTMNSAHILLGPDGNVWFPGVNTIDRAKPDGTITEYTAPTARAFPYGVAIGADGNIWFTEHGTGQIGQLVLSSATDGGQATIVESDLFPFGISSADELFLIPQSPQAMATATGNRPMTDSPCQVAFMVNDSGSEPGQNLTAVTVSKPSACADLALMIHQDPKRINGALVLDTTIMNRGPQYSDSVRATIKFSPSATVSTLSASLTTINQLISSDPEEQTTTTKLPVVPSADGSTFTVGPVNLPADGVLIHSYIDILTIVEGASTTEFAFVASDSTPDPDLSNNRRVSSAATETYGTLPDIGQIPAPGIGHRGPHS